MGKHGACKSCRTYMHRKPIAHFALKTCMSPTSLFPCSEQYMSIKHHSPDNMMAPWMDNDDLWRNHSFTSIRRSVSGMKNLLPLRLLAHPSADEEVPPMVPKYMSYGTSRPLRAKPAPLEFQKRIRPKSTNRNRDTPIYTEPGTPLCGRAYLTDEDLGRMPSRTKRQDHPTQENRRPIKKLFTKSLEAEEPIWFKAYPSRLNSLQEHDYPVRSRCSSRSSGMSFQCAGQPWDDETEERSLFDKSHWPKVPHAQRSCPTLRTTETVAPEPCGRSTTYTYSWLSDVSSVESDEEILSCATALAPARAHVINVNRLSSQSTKILRRSSSLTRPPVHAEASVNNRNSWTSYIDTPPPTSRGEEEDDDDDHCNFEEPSTPINYRSKWHDQNEDLAMNSPPLTPMEPFPDYDCRPVVEGKQKRNSFCRQSLGDSRRLPPRPVEIPEEYLGIICDIEDMTSNFPSTMLLLDTPCITEIRTQLFPLSSLGSRNSSSRIPLPSGCRYQYSPYYNPPPEYVRRPRNNTLTLYPNASSCTTATYCTPDQFAISPMSPLLSSHPQSQPHEPNLAPFQRLFPQSSSAMRSALYSHLLSHIFVSTLFTPPPPPPQLRFSSTPDRQSKAATKSLSTTQEIDIINSYNDTMYLAHLEGELKRCIFTLVSVMDERTTGGFINEGMGDVVLNCLEEVVRGIEGSF